MEPFGVLLVDKPVGITSFEVIRKIRKITSIRKIGHTGTLDPFASGLLPVCIGKATRISDRLMKKEKEYSVVMKLGVQTATGDTEGDTIATKFVPDISETDLINLIPKIKAIKTQIPPQFSAVKIKGKRAYELARNNQVFTIKPRSVKIIDFQITDFCSPILKYKVCVSKGTYIRTLSETIAELLGTVGTTIELCRTGIGDVLLSEAVKLETLNAENWQNFLIPIPQLLPEIPVINIDNVDYFRNGRFLPVEHQDEDYVMVFSQQNELLGFGKISASELRPKTVLI